MPRNTGGVYSLPNPPFVSGTVISSTVMNQQLSDLASAMTESLSRSGNGDMQVPLTGPDGSAALPTYAWASDPGSGFWLPSTGMVRLTSSAATLQQWTTTGVTINPATTLGSTLAVAGATTLSSTLAVTGNATIDGNTTLGNAVGDTTTISGPTTVGAALAATGAVTSNAGGECFLAQPGSADHAYVGFYARTATPTTRTGFVGFGSASATNLVLGNLIAGGNINIIPGTGAQVLVEGNVRFNSVSNPASTTAFANAITPTNIVKAWAKITTTGTGLATVNGGFNVSGVTVSGSTMTVTFAQSFANASYGVHAIMQSFSGVVNVGAQAAGTVNIHADELTFDVGGEATGGPTNFATSVRTIYITCIGAQ
jgi:hypothetical protein